MNSWDEQVQIEKARRDPRAFGPIYDRYVERVYGFIFRRTGDHQLAEDITAATFETALRNIRQFKWQGTGMIAWLYRIARNIMIGHFRRQRFVISLTNLFERGYQPRTKINFVERFETHDWLVTAFAQLSSKDQEIIALRFFEDLSSDEVANILKCSKNVLYLRLHRALERLRKALKKTDEIREVSSEEA